MGNEVTRLELLSGEDMDAPISGPHEAGQVRKLGAWSAIVILALVALAYFAQEVMYGSQWLRQLGADYGVVWDERRALTIASAALLLSGLGAGLLACAGGSLTAPVGAAPGHARRGSERLGRWTLAAFWLVLLASIGCAAAAQWRIITVGEDVLTRGYWLLSMAVFIGAQAILAYASAPLADSQKSPPFRAINWAVFGLIVVAAFALRAYDIGELPRQLNQDVAIVGNDARANLSERGLRIFGTSHLGSPQMALALPTLSMALFGQDLAGLRMTGVLLGTIMVGAVYVLVWRAFDSHRLAGVASLLIALHNPLIQFSRHIYNIDPWGVFAVAIAFAVHGFRSDRVWPIGIAGLLTGFTTQLYLSSRVVPIILAVFIFFVWQFRSSRLSRPWAALGAFLCGTVLCWAPNLVDLWRSWPVWRESNRVGSTLMWVTNLHSVSVSTKLVSLPEIFFLRLDGIAPLFHVFPDTSGQTTVNKPLFDRVVGPLMWIGLGTCLAAWKRKPLELLLVLSFVLTIGVGCMLTMGGSYWPKIVLLMLVGVIFVAIGYEAVSCACAAIAGGAAGLLRQPVLVWRRVAAGAVCALFCGAVIVEGALAWDKFRTAGAYDANVASILGWNVAALPPGTKVCGVEDDAVDLNHLEVVFVANKQARKGMGRNTPVATALAQCGEGPAVWIISANQGELEAALRAKFPNAQVTQILSPRAEPIFKVLKAS